MVDLVSVATFVLAGVTLVLVYVTYTLKRATDYLARTQILPRLALATDPYYEGQTQRLLIKVVNMGIATAFNTRVFATVLRNNTRVEAESQWGGRDILPVYESSQSPVQALFKIEGILEGLDITLELLYEDGEGHPYKKEVHARTPPKEKVSN